MHPLHEDGGTPCGKQPVIHGLQSMDHRPDARVYPSSEIAVPNSRGSYDTKATTCTSMYESFRET